MSKRSLKDGSNQPKSAYRIPRTNQVRQHLLEDLEDRLVLAGTPVLIEINPSGDSDPAEFVQLGDLTFFSAEDANSGRELWVTDGTDSGTRLVRDINVGSDHANPESLIAYNNRLYFSADDGINGRELWSTDGTSAGTMMVTDIHPGEGYQYPNPSGPLNGNPTNPVIFNGEIFFSAEDADFGTELWKTDGTQSGTENVVDVAEGSYDNYPDFARGSDPANLTVANGLLFFTADDREAGRELWRTNGTAAGTAMVKDIYAGSAPYYYDGYFYGVYPNASEPGKLTNVNGTLFFIATNETNGRELWKSDGTDAGTVLVKDIQVGAADGLNNGNDLAEFNGSLIFTATDGINGTELWISDGTEAGTTLLKDVRSGIASGLATTSLTEVEGLLYFAATDGSNGTELWRTDGSEDGTFMVADVEPSSGSSFPEELTNVNGTLYFSAFTTASGRELFTSDGTSAGTQLVNDANVGGGGSNPENLFAIDNLLLFSADNGTHGRELFAVQDSSGFDVRIQVVVDGEPVAIPANIGIDGSGNRLAQITSGTNGTLNIAPVQDEALNAVTLGDFFETWRTNAGAVGNNANATFSATNLLGNQTDANNTISAFVNGQLITSFEDYVLTRNDDIMLVYGDNPVVSLNTNFGSLYFELFADETPITVTNFLNYVNDGDYINSFFHRLVPEFVIQGGGFTTSSEIFSNVSQFTDVPEDPTIQNEPGISNIRGTIAMAKLGGDPNSASSQFFVNLEDNSANLDAQNGGFAVFGQVLDMTVPDAMATLTPTNLDSGGVFSAVPSTAEAELIVIQSVDGLGTIQGTKYNDANANGNFDSGESGLAGVTIYVDANDNGLFDTDEYSTTTDSNGDYVLHVPTGTHFIRSGLAAGRLQTFPIVPDSYTLNVEIGEVLEDFDFGEADLPAPTNFALVAASDTGISNSDGITRLNNSSSDTTLTFTMSGVANTSEVQIFANNTLIATADGTGGDLTVETDGSTLIPDGTIDFTVVQVFGGLASEPSSPLTLTIDSTGPAAFTTAAPDLAQAGNAFSFDVNSPDEGTGGNVYSLVNAPSGMQIDNSGVITWTPTSAQAVPQSFQIVLADSAGNQTSQDVEMTVLGVIPALPESYTATEDTMLTVNAAQGVLANDGDANSGTLSASLISSPANGSVTLNADGSFSYTPNADFSGEDSFTYQASDGSDESNVAKVTINVSSTNDPPSGVADTYSTNEDVPLVRTAANGVLANDTDPDGDTLTAARVTSPSNGSLILNADGSFTYTPSANFFGTDSFTYTVSDGTSTSNPITVNLTVTEVDDPPIANADTYSVNEDATLTVTAASGVLANDTDSDSDSLVASVATTTTQGTLSLNSDGSFEYTPNANFFGTDRFTYRLFDGQTQTDPVTATITVVGQPDSPVATNDTLTVTNTPSQQINVLQNDSTDPDGQQDLIIRSVTQGSNGGSLTIGDGGTLFYSPAEGFIGSETFSYTVEDEDGLTDTATVTLTVTDAAPNVISGFVYIDQDKNGVRASSEIGVPGSQISLTGTDSSGGSVTLTTLTANNGFYSFTEVPAGSYTLTQTQPTALMDGTDSTTITGAVAGNDRITNISLSGGATFTENNFGELQLHAEYVSIVWFFASTGTETGTLFREIVATGEQKAGKSELAAAIRSGGSVSPPTDGGDGNGGGDGTNRAPSAVANSYSVAQGQTLSVTTANGVLANDTDPDGDSLTATVVTSPQNGTLSLNANGSFTYTPNATFTGADTFRYRATDGDGLFAEATVTITVNSTPNTFVIAENSPIGTSVGFVDTAGLGDTVILDFDQPNLREELQLVPDDHLNGDAASPVVLIEYLDLQCPICRTYHPIIRDLEEEFEGELLVVSRHFPLESPHPNALAAAQAAEAADRQGRFDDYVDLLYENQDDWADEADPQSFFEEYATDLGLNLTAFRQDMEDPAILERIRRDQEVAPEIGATGTPTFFLQGEQLTDLPNDLNEFESLIEDELDLVTRPFSLDRRTGEISVRSATQLDFETNPSFTLDLIVTNLNGVVSPVEVTILLTNVSEVAPVANADAYTLVQDTTLQINATNGVLANDSDEEDDPLTAELVTSPANGTLTLNDDGSFTYTPSAGFVGSDSFTYRATDGVFDSNAVTVSLAVTLDEGNVAPTAVNDAYVVNQGNVLTVATADGVLKNDSDTDGDSLTAFIFTAPANGTVSLNQDGSFTYTPVSGFSGTDSFTYRANDGNLNSTAAIVAITVNPINNRPTSEADRYEVDEDGQLDVDNINGLLANDADADGDTLTAQLLDGPSNGSLTLNENGSFTYTPAAGFVGTETFTYRATDGQLLSDTTTVTIVVNPQNDTPVAVDDAYETNEDSPLNVDAVSGLLLNDTDADSDTLTVTVISQPTNGTVVLEETGAFVYTPAANFFGFDSFTYVANDGTADSNVATVTIEVIGLDDAPVAEDDLFTIGVDETLTLAAEIGVLANDVDADGDTLTVTLVTDVNSGTLTLSADGSIMYEPANGFQGSVSFEYQVSDGAQSSIGTATIIVNNRPVAQDDQYQVDEEQTLTVAADLGVLANDSDANSDALSAVLRSAPSNGSVTLNSDGSFEYLPNANFAGTDSFTYVANDNLSDSEVATVTIEVANMNDAPVANDDSYTANLNTELTINAASGVLANDADMENDSLTVSLVATVSNGSLTLNADGSFSYLPNTDFVGTDSFTYIANDGQADSEIATVTITVADASVQLTAADDFYSVAVDGVLDVSEATGVLANDSHSGNQPFVAALITTVANGTLVFNTNGAFDYSPNTGFQGTDSFTYAITDGVNASLEGTVTIEVNSAPVAQADEYSTLPGQQLSVDASQGILANDTDADGDTLSITVVDSTANGVLDASSDGSFSYTPDGGFIGTDSFTYTVSDGLATTDETTVTIVVSSGNTPPAAVEDSYGVEFNGELNVFAAQGVLANDSDGDGDSLTAVLVDSPNSGTVNLQPDGSFTYSPNSNFVGTDAFTYVANDGTSDSETVTVTITVSVAPFAQDDDYSVSAGQILEIPANLGVLNNDFDPEGDSLTAILTRDPSNGIVTLSEDGSFIYAPAAGFSGPDTFGYVANDGISDSNEGTVTIAVRSGVVNTAPVAVNDLYSVTVDGSLDISAAEGLLANDTDADGDTLTVSLVADVNQGSLNLQSDGAFTYTPPAGFHGVAQFTYTASDGVATSDTTNVAILVNTSPLANPDGYTGTEDILLTATAGTGVLANDDDPDGDALVATLAQAPSSGTVVLSSNGAFEYQPNANFSGTDTFTYTVSDGFAQSGEVLVVLTIRPVNDAPEAADDSYTIDSDQTLTVSVGDGVLANDSDQENNPMTAILDQAPANGSVTLNGDGSFTYTPNALFSGTDFFTYVTDDGTSSSEPATVTIDVTSPTGQLVTVAAAQDATLYEDLTGSQANGAGEFLFVGSNSDGDRRRALVEFDLAGADIPPGALITNVTLTMNMSQTASGSNLVSLHPIDASWSEGTSDAAGDEQFGAISTLNDATWIHRQFNTTNWTTAGGDFNSSASASTLVDAVGSYTWSSPQMITDVEGWLSDPSSNFGWLLMGVEVANSYKRFDSSENGTAENRPVLTITWDSTFVASAEGEPEDFPSEIVAAALPDTISDSSSMPLPESAGETLAASVDLESETSVPVDMADLMFMRIDDASESYSVLLKALASNRSAATDDIFAAEDTNWRPL